MTMLYLVYMETVHVIARSDPLEPAKAENDEAIQFIKLTATLCGCLTLEYVFYHFWIASSLLCNSSQ